MAPVFYQIVITSYDVSVYPKQISAADPQALAQMTLQGIPGENYPDTPLDLQFVINFYPDSNPLPTLSYDNPRVKMYMYNSQLFSLLGLLNFSISKTGPQVYASYTDNPPNALNAEIGCVGAQSKRSILRA